MTAKLRALLFAFVVVSSAAPAFGETIEQFYRRMSAGVTEDMLHPDGRFIVMAGDQAAVFSSDQLVAIQKEANTLGVKTEVVSMNILATHEVADTVSVAARLQLKQTLGGQTKSLETVGQDLLLKKGDTYVVVFSLSRPVEK